MAAIRRLLPTPSNKSPWRTFRPPRADRACTQGPIVHSANVQRGQAVHAAHGPEIGKEAAAELAVVQLHVADLLQELNEACWGAWVQNEAKQVNRGRMGQDKFGREPNSRAQTEGVPQP